MAHCSIPMLSLNFPSAVLHGAQRSPRTFPVAWSWSTWTAQLLIRSRVISISFLQMAHLPSCASSIASTCCELKPYFFRMRDHFEMSRYLSEFLCRWRLTLPLAASRTCSRLASVHRLCLSLAHCLQSQARPFLLRASLPNSSSGFRMPHVRQNRPFSVTSSMRGSRGFCSRHFLYDFALWILIFSGFNLPHSLARRALQFLHLYEYPLLRQRALPKLSRLLSSSQSGQIMKYEIN